MEPSGPVKACNGIALPLVSVVRLSRLSAGPTTVD
jgi:hypothetical protein